MFTRVKLALTPALTSGSKRLPGLTLCPWYSSLGLTPAIAHQGDSVQMVTTCRRNMSMLPSVMRCNPWVAACDLAHVSQTLHRRGQARSKTNSETQSISPASTKLVDNRNVQQVASSEDERNRIEAEIQLLEAQVQMKKEEICKINRFEDQSMTILEANQDKLFDENLRELKEVQARLLRAIKDCNELEAQFAACEVGTSQQSSTDFVTSVSSLNGKEPNPKRKHRWIELNKILKTKTRKAKGKVSIAYTQDTWDQVKTVINPTHYEQPRRNIEDEKLDFLKQYLSITTKCFGLIELKETVQRLHLIAPILVCVCNLFDGDIDIVVEEDLVGNFVKAQSHFEFLLRRRNKAVCIVLAKNEAYAQGMAKALVGCEVAAEVEGLEIVYGIVTDYVRWNFLRCLDDKVEWQECSLYQTHEGPNRDSLKEIAEKIYSMLSSEDTQG